jgi:hypothetical protein
LKVASKIKVDYGKLTAEALNRATAPAKPPKKPKKG